MRVPKILSILWHSVEPDSVNPDFIHGGNPTASVFREQMRFLVERYSPVSITEFMDLVGGRSHQRVYTKPPVLLTFDDGFKNVIEQALPILEEFEAPALFFVLGAAIQNPDFVPWYVEGTHALRKTRKKSLTHNEVPQDLTSKSGRKALKSSLYAAFKACRTEEDRQRVLTSFAELLGVDRPTARDLDDDLRFLAPHELGKLGPTSLLTIASHGMTHRFLDSLTREEQAYELKESHALLSKINPAYFPAFAYPGGWFNSDTLAIARETYKCALATVPGATYRDSYRYPRVGLGGDTIQQLEYAINPHRLTYIIPIKRFLYDTGVLK